MKELLRLESISKKYQAKNGETEALKNVSFSINEGEFVSIIGPSRLWKIYTSFNYCWTGKKLWRKALHRW